MIYSLLETIPFQDDPEPYVMVVKYCLNWRFFIPSEERDFDNWKSYTALLCVLDEEIGDILIHSASC
jgi:hypothetical protein